MDIRKLWFMCPETLGSSLEQGCKKSGILFKRVSLERKTEDLKDSDLLIDSFFGDPVLKQKIIKEAVAAISEKTTVASNPFSLSLTQIGSFAERRDKVIGFLPAFHSGIILANKGHTEIFKALFRTCQ